MFDKNIKPPKHRVLDNLIMPKVLSELESKDSTGRGRADYAQT